MGAAQMILRLYGRYSTASVLPHQCSRHSRTTGTLYDKQSPLPLMIQELSFGSICMDVRRARWMILIELGGGAPVRSPNNRNTASTLCPKLLQACVPLSLYPTISVWDSSAFFMTRAWLRCLGFGCVMESTKKLNSSILRCH